MCRFQGPLLFVAVIFGIPQATLAQDANATHTAESEPALSTQTERRQHVLKSAVAFADNLDRLSSQRIIDGNLEQAMKIKEHADLVRVGFHLPTETSRVEGLVIIADLQRAIDEFESARSLAVEACDAARRNAMDEGEVFLIQELTAERNTLRADAARDFQVWDTDPGAWEDVRAGRAAHRIPQIFSLESNRIPDELNVRFGPQRFLINGRGRHDTFRFQRRVIGHMGKIGIVDRQLTEEEPVLRGVIRSGDPKMEGIQHVVAFVQGNRVADNSQFNPTVHRIYDWKAELRDGEIEFTMTDGSRTVVDTTVNAATLTRIAFVVAVRNPGQEASLYAAWK